VQWCWVTAQLYEQQIFTGVFAVTQACWQPVVHSSTGKWCMLFAKNSAAMQWCWVTAQLYEQQIFIGVFAVTQACWQPVVYSSTGKWCFLCAKNRVAVHWCWVTVQLYKQQIFTGVFAVTQPADNLFCTAALNSGGCFLPRTVLQCNGAGSLHSCINSKSSQVCLQ